MTLHLYNSLTRKTEPLTTIEPGIVRMYVCGVTVYDEAHIGTVGRERGGSSDDYVFTT